MDTKKDIATIIALSYAANKSAGIQNPIEYRNVFIRELKNYCTQCGILESDLDTALLNRLRV